MLGRRFSHPCFFFVCVFQHFGKIFTTHSWIHIKAHVKANVITNGKANVKTKVKANVQPLVCSVNSIEIRISWWKLITFFGVRLLSPLLGRLAELTVNFDRAMALQDRRRNHRECPWRTMALLYFMVISLLFHGHFMVISWLFHGYFLVIWWFFNGIWHLGDDEWWLGRI